MQKIRKGDEVVVLAGKDKDKRGVVLQVLVKESALLVEGVNRVKRHQKPNPVKGQSGGVREKEQPVHTSKVGLFNPVIRLADRVGFKDVGGQKVRYFKSNGQEVEV